MIWSGNANAIRALYGTNQGLQPTDPGRFYNLDEEDFASDLQATYAATLFGMPPDGLIGVYIEDVNRRLNAYLTPVKSNHYDMSLEWYFAPGSYASATAFYRDIKGYVQTYVTDEVIGGFVCRLEPQ